MDEDVEALMALLARLNERGLRYVLLVPVLADLRIISNLPVEQKRLVLDQARGDGETVRLH